MCVTRYVYLCVCVCVCDKVRTLECLCLYRQISTRYVGCMRVCVAMYVNCVTGYVCVCALRGTYAVCVCVARYVRACVCVGGSNIYQYRIWCRHSWHRSSTSKARSYMHTYVYICIHTYRYMYICIYIYIVTSANVDRISSVPFPTSITFCAGKSFVSKVVI